MVDSSFYGDTPNYATAYPTQNDSNTNPVTGNTNAPSSFYPNGGVYVELANSDDVLAAAANSAASAAASATGAASSATASAASAAAAAASASTASTTFLQKANNLSDLTSVATAKANLSLVKADVGLGNVDNTSDVNKPVSTAQANADALKANIASPALTGTPTAPTATAGTNTTQIATTAFVLANGGALPSSTTPLVDSGAGAVGTGTTYARADHAHPTDTSRAPLVSPSFTGTPAINNAGQGLLLIGNGVTTPTKFVRCNSGIFQVVNDANTAVILSLTDAGDLSWPGGAWASYTPSVSVTGGAGTANGFYKLLGKTVLLKVQITITTGGSSATFGLPFTAANGNAYIAGRELAATGNTYVASLGAGGATGIIFRYDNISTMVAGYSIALTGIYEAV